MNARKLTDDIVMRGCPAELVRAAKIRAFSDGITFKDWVLGLMAERLKRPYEKPAHGNKRSRNGNSGTVVEETAADEATKASEVSAKVQASGYSGGDPGMSSTGSLLSSGKVLIPGAKCSICGSGVYLFKDPQLQTVKWKCVGAVSHTMTPRVEKVKTEDHVEF